MCNMLPPTRNENMLFYSPKAVKLVLLSDRTRDGPSQTSWPLDPMRARPRHQPLAPTSGKCQKNLVGLAGLFYK